MIGINGKLINPEVRIETTNDCQSKCITCPRERMKRPIAKMPFNHFKYLVEQADELGAFTISPFGYGEPLLDNELPDKIALCSEMGFETNITTNAALLHTDNIFALLKAGLTHIRFSVHGTKKKNYEKVHKGLIYEDVIRNIFNFIVINNRRFFNTCKTSVTVMPLHGETIDDVLALWQDKIDDIEIWKPHGWAGRRAYRKKTKRGKVKSCNRPFSGPIQVQADGTVIPCCFVTDSELIMGNTYEKSLQDILNDYPYQWLRQMHEDRIKCYPCMNCDQYYEQKESPLLYSTIDPECKAGKTSTIKFEMTNKGETKNDLYCTSARHASGSC